MTLFGIALLKITCEGKRGPQKTRSMAGLIADRGETSVEKQNTNPANAGRRVHLLATRNRRRNVPAKGCEKSRVTIPDWEVGPNLFGSSRIQIPEYECQLHILFVLCYDTSLLSSTYK